MRYLHGFAAIAAIAMLAGCMPLPTTTPEDTGDVSAQIDVAEVQAALAPGHAIIKGQAFAKTVGGDVKYGAGNTVYLAPDDFYMGMCFMGWFHARQPACFTKLEPHLRTTVADGQGNFEFDGVKPGKYVVETLITWGVPSMYGIETSGGVLTGKVTVVSDTDVLTVYPQTQLH